MQHPLLKQILPEKFLDANPLGFFLTRLFSAWIRCVQTNQQEVVVELPVVHGEIDPRIFLNPYRGIIVANYPTRCFHWDVLIHSLLLKAKSDRSSFFRFAYFRYLQDSVQIFHIIMHYTYHGYKWLISSGLKCYQISSKRKKCLRHISANIYFGRNT